MASAGTTTGVVPPAAVLAAARSRVHEQLLDDAVVRLFRRPRSPDRPVLPVHQVLLLPVGDRCNLACAYCYEAERRHATPGGRMDRVTLRRVLDHLLPFVPDGLQIALHGGEPLLAGRPWVETLLTRLADEPPGRVAVSVQTNGTLLDEGWARLFAAHRVSVGVSLDGPPDDHDALRVGPDRRGSHARVAQGLRALEAAGVPHGVITVVGPRLARDPDGPARLLAHLAALGVRSFDVHPAYSPTTPEANVSPVEFAGYLNALIDAWLAHGDPGLRIGFVDQALQGVLGHTPPVCYFSGACTTIIGVAADGSVLPCTRPFGDEHVFGNLAEDPLPAVLGSGAFRRFTELERRPRAEPPACEWHRVCGGGCPHERLGADGRQDVAGRHVYCTCVTGEPGGYPAIFTHLRQRVADLLEGT